MKPYYTDDQVTLWQGDALDVLRPLPSCSVDCCVTSPPYYGLRDYGVDPTEWPALPEHGVPAMVCALGLEPTPRAFVAHLDLIFAEVWRLLADDGTLWINLGDSYSSSGGHTDHGATSALQGRRVRKQQGVRTQIGDRPTKNLLGIPWRVAFALQDAGWILRKDVIWHKTNPMPESVTDRPSSSHEYVFLLTKKRSYHFDLDAIREPTPDIGRKPKTVKAGPLQGNHGAMGHDGAGMRMTEVYNNPRGRNPGSVWSIATQPFADAHFATFPVKLARRCIAAGCKPRGTVLDPFHGSGTTGLAATELGCRYVGIDLSAEYLDLSLRTRLRQPGLIGEAI